MSVSRHSPINPSIPTFTNISLTQTMANFPGKSIKNGCNNFYLHPKNFHKSLKLNSYLLSVSRRGPIIPIKPTFCNINLTQAMTDLLVAWKINKKWLQ